eukprot:gene7244-11562_t
MKTLVLLVIFAQVLFQTYGQLAVVTETYTFGSNLYGELGIKNSRVPLKLSVEGKQVKSVCSGLYHITAVTTDNSVYTWGSGAKGSLGISGATTSSTYYTPQKIVSNSALNISSIGCGDAHTVFYENSLSIQAFGDKNYFAGVTQNSTFETPTIVDLLINKTFTKTFAFGQVSFFLDSQKKLWGTGNNGVGQLGEENNPIRSTPVKNAILSNTNIKSVVGSTSMTVYLSESGNIYTSGSNQKGELGLNRTDSNNPVSNVTAIPFFNGLTVTTVGHGYRSTLVVTSEPKLYGYGLNDNSQLGFNGTDNIYNSNGYIIYPQPSNAIGLQGTINQISIGKSHSLIKTSTGKVYCAGSNLYGQCGTDSYIQTYTSFVEISTKNFGATAIFATEKNSYAINTAGDLYGWGDFERLGLSITTPTPSKVLLQNNDSFIGAAAGDGYSLFTTTYTGKLYGFGRNDANQVNPNHKSVVNFPEEIVGSSIYGNFSSVVIGGKSTTTHVMAIGTNRYKTLYGWGSNLNGQLGSGSKTDPILPTNYVGITPIVTTSVNVTSDKVVVGMAHTIVLGSLSPLLTPINLHVFGSNNNGQIAQAGFDRNLAFRVQLTERVTDAAAGDEHTLYIKSNELIVMGDNSRGQIGLGEFPRISILTKLNATGTSEYATKLWAGSYTSFILTTGGLYVTGDNTNGALGLPLKKYYKTPVLHPFTTFKTDPVLKIAAAKGGGQHTLVLLESGAVYSMGIGSSGQLGTNNYTTSYEPVLVTPPNTLPTGYKALDIAAGSSHSIIIYGKKDCPSDCKPNNILKGTCDTVQGICRCFSQYLGESCELFQCQDPNCSSNGNCDTSNGICKCNSGYDGKICQYRSCPNSCSGNGICQRTTGTCSCNSGFTGVDCSTVNSGAKILISFTAMIVGLLFALL